MPRVGLFEHRKFRRLSRELGGDAIAAGSLELLWYSAYTNADESIGDSVDVEAAARWQGEPGKLCAALTVSGFIDGDDAEGYRVHDLWDHAPDYVHKKAGREAARRAAGKTLAQVRSEAGRRGRFAQLSSASGGQVSGQLPASVGQVAPLGLGREGLGREGIPPVSPPRGTPADLFGGPAISEKKKSKVQREREAHEASAVVVLSALSDARRRVISGALPLKPTTDNLKNITARLAAGASVEDCLHVIAVREAEVRAKPDSAQWFNAATTFTADQFTRSMGQTTRTVVAMGTNGGGRVIGMAARCGTDIPGDG